MLTIYETTFILGTFNSRRANEIPVENIYFGGRIL
jgi:hypothetical protein